VQLVQGLSTSAPQIAWTLHACSRYCRMASLAINGIPWPGELRQECAHRQLAAGAHVGQHQGEAQELNSHVGGQVQRQPQAEHAQQHSAAACSTAGLEAGWFANVGGRSASWLLGSR